MVQTVGLMLGTYCLARLFGQLAVLLPIPK